MGRPKGSKNKPKTPQAVLEEAPEAIEYPPGKRFWGDWDYIIYETKKGKTEFHSYTENEDGAKRLAAWLEEQRPQSKFDIMKVPTPWSKAPIPDLSKKVAAKRRK